MTLQLGEGQSFAADYSLISRLHRREHAENWVALDQSSGERVVLKIFDGEIASETRTRVENAVVATRGLVHPNIARVYRIDQSEGNDYIVCQYVRGGTPLAPILPAGEELSRRWPVIDQLLDAISFAHGLGLAHGHLHPGNILTDDQGRLSITDFGLPPSLQDDLPFENWLSNQVIQGALPDSSDDIYSLGQLLSVMLTDKPWREGTPFEPNRPVPSEVSQLVTRMLSDSAYERPKDLTVIKDTVRRYMLGDTDAPLEALGEFRRGSTAASAKPTETPTEPHLLPRERQAISAPVALAGLVALIVIGLAIFMLLPGGSETPTVVQNETPPAPVAQPSSPAPSAGVSELPVLTPLERARLEQMEEQGAELARDLLRLQVELEDIGVQIWGRDAFDAAVDKTTEADEIYRGDDFEAALAMYQEAKGALEDLQDSADAVKAENVAAGEAAIENRDPEAAILAFTIVTAIDAADAAAEERLALAENLEILLDRLDEAEFLEQENQLDEARDLLRSALALESSWQPAIDALARVEAGINQRRFNDAMSAALAALGEGNFDTARARFEDASNILPDSPEPADGLQQVEIGILQQQVSSLRERALAFEADETWQEAVGIYEETLTLDATLVFATEGLERARSRLDLDERIGRFVETPTLMSSDDELRDARRVLAEAARIRESNTKLKDQVDKLAHHITLARIPVPIELRSDNRTDVTVYRYGNLGRIEATSIELIPGQYTIVGKRRGYRDAQYDLTLLGGMSVPPIYIACTEEI